MDGHKKILISVGLTIMLFGSPSAQAATFKDVKETHWAYSAIEWGSNKGIATGYGDGTFKPSEPVTTEEFLSMLIRSYKGKLTPTNGRWSDPYYAIASRNNYPTGADRGSKISRTAVAEIIAGTQGKNYSGDYAIQYMLVNGLAGGKTSNTIEGYEGYETLTRAEALVFIKNVLEKTKGSDIQVRPAVPSDTSELPKIENPLKINVVDGFDSTLEKYARKMGKAVAKIGYTAGYNKGQKRAFIQDPDEVVIMAYNDATGNGEGTQVVAMGGMVDGNTDKVDDSCLKAVIAAMGSLGLPNGQEISNAIVRTLTYGDVPVLKVNGLTLEFTPVAYGRLVIYIK